MDILMGVRYGGHGLAAAYLAINDYAEMVRCSVFAHCFLFLWASFGDQAGEVMFF